MSVFDAATGVLDLGPYTASILKTSTATALFLGQATLPYDAEITGFSALADVISDGTGATTSLDNDVWVDVRVTPINPTTGALGARQRLLPQPSAAVNITKAKVDQGIVTFVVPSANVLVASANSTASAAVTNSATLALQAGGSNYAAGQGVAGAGIPFGTKILSIATNTLTLDRPVTVAAGATVYGTTFGLPAVGDSVTIANINDTFFSNFNNPTNGFNVNGKAPLFWKVLDARLDGNNNYFFKIGPVAQNLLFDIGSGFWKFTTSDSTNAGDALLPYCTTLSQGTVVVANAARLKSSSSPVSILLPAPTSNVLSADTTNAFVTAPIFKAGTRVSAEIYKVNSRGAYNNSNAAVDYTANLVLSVGIKKV